MPQPTIAELVAQMTEAIRLDDDATLLNIADALAPRIGNSALISLVRAVTVEQRSSTTSLQLIAPPYVRFA